jgi:multisubunit Na+/H+ antiporter MnhB subunit
MGVDGTIAKYSFLIFGISLFFLTLIFYQLRDREQPFRSWRFMAMGIIGGILFTLIGTLSLLFPVD